MSTNTLNTRQLAAMIDYAYLKTSGLNRSIEQHCEEAAAYGFAMVAIHPCDVERCAQILHGTQVHVGAVVGFPLGYNTREVKEYETQDAIQRGANEIDMMINLRALQAGEYKTVANEITSIVRICQVHGAVSKIILEACYLTEDQKIAVCKMALDAGANYVKTSTGFGTGGATVQDVKLMRTTVGNRMGVKAAGGIRDLAITLRIIEAGADRIGTSRGVAIIEELKSKMELPPTD